MQEENNNEALERDVEDHEATPSRGAQGAKRKRKGKDADRTTEQIIELLKQSGKDEDQEYHFGMAIADRLRKLSPRSKSLAQMKIQMLLFKLEFPSDDESVHE